MAHVKFRRWGPYVWWICPSRKCNFENKTDLAFVQDAFETKCQYCNTPVTIKMSGGQLSLESSVAEEEEPKTAAAPTPGAKPIVASPSPQSSLPPPTQTAPPTPPSEAAEHTIPTKPAAEAPARRQESASKSKETKKKAAS